MNVIDLTAESSDPVFGLIYGDSGSGKTHLAATLAHYGKVLFIDIDKGFKTVKYAADLSKYRSNIVVVSFDQFGDLDTAYKAIKQNDPAVWNKLLKTDLITEPFAFVIWDTWSELQWNMLQELRRSSSEMSGNGLTFRKGLQIQHWGQMTDLNKLAVEQLRDCKKVNQFFIMQEKLTKDDISGQLFGGPAIHGQLVQEMPAYFDIVIRTYADLTGKFCATTKPVGKWTAKTRIGEGKVYQNPTGLDILGGAPLLCH